MDSNQQRFIDDTLDLLTELDKALLCLEEKPGKESVEEIFRIMHTVKGGANMLGFESLGALSHEMESLYDLIRNVEDFDDPAMITMTLQAFEDVRGMLEDPESYPISDPELFADHIQHVHHWMDKYSSETGISSQGTASIPFITYLIRVKTTTEIKESDEHPLLFLVQDMKDYGPCQIFTYYKNKKKKTVDYWDIVLSAQSPKDELEAYFLFVDDDCTYEVTNLGEGKWMEEKPFQDHLKMLEKKKEAFSSESLQEFIKDLQEENTATAGQPRKQSSPEGDKDAAKLQRENYIKVRKEKIDDLLNWMSELITIQSQFENMVQSQTRESQKLYALQERLHDTTQHLIGIAFEVGMVSFESLVVKLRKLIRSLSNELGKKVNLLVEGGDTELDKNLIDALADPLLHIIRNSLDHGIESPAERLEKGKDSSGSINLKIVHSGSFVELYISDDGRGIDTQKLLAKAQKLELPLEENPSKEAILSLIFQSGFSTADKVSAISGRGVGMDAVQEKIKALKGEVTVESEKEKGTSFHIRLPLTNAIVEGLLCKVGEGFYVIPLHHVQKIERLPSARLQKAQQLNKSLFIDSEAKDIVVLRDFFHSPDPAPATSDVLCLQLEHNADKAVAVDRVMGKIQAVLKPLGDQYKEQSYFSGSAILGDGSIAIILDANFLWKPNVVINNEHLNTKNESE